MYTYVKREAHDTFWIINIAAAFLIGAVMYCCLHSGVFLSRLAGFLAKFDRLISEKNAVSASQVSDICLFVTNFVLGYALVISLGCVLKNTPGGLRKALAFSVMFELFMIIVQFLTRFQGRFDASILTADIAADIAAVLVIYLRERKYA